MNNKSLLTIIEMKKSTHRILLGALFTLMYISLIAQPATSLVKVTVTPDRADWTYKVGETARFSVEVTRFGHLMEGVTIDYETGPEGFPDVRHEGVVLKTGKTDFSGSMKTPGFYRVRVWAVVDGKRYEASGTAGFDPYHIAPAVQDPADFDTFWSGAIANARKLPLDARMTLLPEKCTGEVNVYHISFQNDLPGSRIYGMLALPKKEGKYPAILRVPGAGIRPYSGDTRMAARGCITLEIGIHGIPVNLDPEVYTSLSAGALRNYPQIRMNDRDNHFYKRVYVGCVKAVDFIFSLPEFDGARVAVTGGSQGGALTLVTAGLDPRITCAAAYYPALSDHAGYLLKRAGGWPHYFKTTEPQPGESETLAYFDVVNFARRITAPGIYSWGYNDLTCPPTSMYAAYNVITAPKELYLFQETGHWTFPEQQELFSNWLIQQLQKK